MKNLVFYVTEELLIETIRKYGKGAASKDYEYAISIQAKRIFEKKYKKPFMIGFEVNPKHAASIKTIPNTPEEVNNVLRNLLEENTIVDFGLAPGTPDNFEGYAYPFQVKRLKVSEPQNIIKELKDFIINKSKVYRDPQTTLLVVPDLDITVNNAEFRRLAQELIIHEQSFRTVLILVNEQSDSQFIQVWPNYGKYL